MFFGQDRNQLRRMYIDSWRKKKNNEALEPLEAMIAEVILLHPEYHALLENEDAAMADDFLPEQGQTNPFLHMGMHIAIHEQLNTDRPPGIAALYQNLMMKIGDPHETEHQIMECLGQVMWEAQRSGAMPDEQAYLECLKRI